VFSCHCLKQTIIRYKHIFNLYIHTRTYTHAYIHKYIHTYIHVHSPVQYSKICPRIWNTTIYTTKHSGYK
jgi:hypothetical protein